MIPNVDPKRPPDFFQLDRAKLSTILRGLETHDEALDRHLQDKQPTMDRQRFALLVRSLQRDTVAVANGSLPADHVSWSTAAHILNSMQWSAS